MLYEPAASMATRLDPEVKAAGSDPPAALPRPKEIPNGIGVGLYVLYSIESAAE